MTKLVKEAIKLGLESKMFSVAVASERVIYTACAISDGKIFDGNSRTDLTNCRGATILGVERENNNGNHSQYLYYERDGFIFQYEKETLKPIGYLCHISCAQAFGFS